MSLSRWLLVLALSSASVALADDAPTSQPTEPAKPAEPAPAPEPAPKPAPEPEAKKKRGKKGQRGQGGFNFGQLRDDLKLDPATMATIRERMGEIDAERRARMKELRQAGAEKAEIKKLAKEYRKQAAGKLKDILGADRWQAWRSKEKERRDARRAGQGAKNKNRAKNRANRGQNKNRGMVSKDQVLKQLKLSEEEAAVVGPLVDGLLETQKLLGQAQAERKKAFQAAALASDDDEALGKLLETYRREKAEDQKTITKARESFREVLSPGQEAKAVALGLLE